MKNKLIWVATALSLIQCHPIFADPETADQFRARYPVSMAEVEKQLNVPPPDEIYQIDSERIEQRPRLYFGKLTLDDIRNRAADPRFASVVAEILAKGEKYAQTPAPAKVDVLALDPNRRYGDWLPWMAAAVLIQKDPHKRTDDLRGLLTWTRAIPGWGKQNQDLVIAQTTVGLCTVYDWLYDELPISDRIAIRAQIIQQVRDSLDESRPGFTMWRGKSFNANHNWFNFDGRAIAALTLWGDTQAPLQPGELKQWLNDAMVDFWIAARTQPSDGACPEGACYQDYGLQPYVDFSTITESLCVLKEPFFDDSMSNAWVRLFMLLPGNVGSFNYGDGYATRWWGTDSSFRKLASYYENPRLQLLADLYAQPPNKNGVPQKPRIGWRDLFWYNTKLRPAKIDDLPLFGDMNDYGIYTARRDWTSKSSFLGIRCGAFGGKTVDKAFGYKMTDAHNYPNLGEFNFYDGTDAIIPGSEYEKVKLTTNHSLVVFDGRGAQAGRSVGQVGEGGEWYYFNATAIPQKPAAMLKVQHTAEYHEYLMDLGGAYCLADERSYQSHIYPDYLRSIVYLPDGAVAVVDKITIAKPRSFQFRLPTTASDLRVTGRQFEFTVNGKSCWIHDFSPTDFARSVRRESLSTIEPNSRNVAILGANNTQSAVFAVVLGVGAAGQGYKIVTDDKGYTLSGLAGDPVRVDWGAAANQTSTVFQHLESHPLRSLACVR